MAAMQMAGQQLEMRQTSLAAGSRLSGGSCTRRGSVYTMPLAAFVSISMLLVCKA